MATTTTTTSTSTTAAGTAIPSFTADDVILKPVTTAEELPELVELCMQALDADPMVKWMEMYTEHDERTSTVSALQEALEDPTYTIIKAVVPGQKEGDPEIVVGFANWLCGYIQLDKVDPFAPKETEDNEQKVVEKHDSKDIADVTSSVPEELHRKAEKLGDWHTRAGGDAERARRLKFGESVFVDSRNYYITAIRGKKHIYIRRIMVYPQFQRRGIAAKLLRHITDEADRQKIVCWLFSRPAGEGLYHKFGFQDVRATNMNDGDVFLCPSVIGMMRPRMD